MPTSPEFGKTAGNKRQVKVFRQIDTEHFGMEMLEPLCRNKSYREGIVLRKDGDAVPEAWKLKCINFLQKEASDMDKGKISDEEMMERYS